MVFSTYRKASKSDDTKRILSSSTGLSIYILMGSAKQRDNRQSLSEAFSRNKVPSLGSKDGSQAEPDNDRRKHSI